MAARVLIMPRRRARVVPINRCAKLGGYAMFDTPLYQDPQADALYPAGSVPIQPWGSPATQPQPVTIPGVQYLGPPVMQDPSAPAPNNFLRRDPIYNSVPPIVYATSLPGVATVPAPSSAASAPPATTVVTTPTSGPIPPPAAVAAAAATPWLEQSLVGGIANKWLLLGGLAAFLLMGGHK